MQKKESRLPLNASGSFFNEALINLDTEQDINQRNTDFRFLLRDLGLRRAKAGRGKLGTPFTGDFSNSLGALGQGFRAATNSAVDRGFSSGSSMRSIAFDPIRREIFDKADRARANKSLMNQSAKQRRDELLAQAAREAAQYGFQNRQPRETR